jgi:hypothetical protein
MLHLHCNGKGTHVLPTLQIDLAKTALFAIYLQILTLNRTRNMNLNPET